MNKLNTKLSHNLKIVSYLAYYMLKKRQKKSINNFISTKSTFLISQSSISSNDLTNDNLKKNIYIKVRIRQTKIYWRVAIHRILGGNWKKSFVPAFNLPKDEKYQPQSIFNLYIHRNFWPCTLNITYGIQRKKFSKVKHLIPQVRVPAFPLSLENKSWRQTTMFQIGFTKWLILMVKKYLLT